MPAGVAEYTQILWRDFLLVVDILGLWDYNTHIDTKEHTMLSFAKNTLARAVLRYNKEREVYKLIVAFNVTERTERGAWKFPPQNKCDFVSGDFVYETLQKDLSRILDTAKQVLRTDNIEVV